jgi:trimethylguanosine synthase
VIAIDNNRQRLEIARHNAIIYGVADRIEFIHADFLDFARSYSQRTTSRKIDVVFLSPPWGGPDYLDQSPVKQDAPSNDEDEQTNYNLKNIRPIPGDELFHLTRRITHNIAYFLPRNVDLDELSSLLKSNPNAANEDAVSLEGEMIEVEEEYMNGKLKAVTCYFGGLASGQEDMF